MIEETMEKITKKNMNTLQQTEYPVFNNIQINFRFRSKYNAHCTSKEAFIYVSVYKKK